MTTFFKKDKKKGMFSDFAHISKSIAAVLEAHYKKEKAYLLKIQ